MMKNKKIKQSEDLLKSAFDHAGEEEFAKICAVTSGMDLPMKHSEQMAWSVIDKAELYDEAERTRRATFKAALRRKRIRNTCVGMGIVAAILLLLYRFGVFDAFLLDKYPYATAYEAAQTYETSDDASLSDKGQLICGMGGASSNPFDFHPGNMLTIAGTQVEVLDQENLPDAFPDIDQEKLKHTVYEALSQYCSENDFAVDDYIIKEQVACRLPIDGGKNEYVLIVHYVGTFLDYQKTDEGKTWSPSLADEIGIRQLPRNMGYISSVLRIDL